MASLMPVGRGRWKIRWREGGRGSAQKASEVFTDKGLALAAKERLESRLAAAKPVGGRQLIPLAELVDRWARFQRERRQPRGQRYIDESEKRLRDLVTARGWTYTSDVTDNDMAIGLYRIYKALMRFARDRYEQPVSPKALLPPDRPRRKRKAKPLLSPEAVMHIVKEAGEWSPGNGAIAHMVAIYGHRPESLVRLTRASFSISYVGHTPIEWGPAQAFVDLVVKGGADVHHELLPQSIAVVEPLWRKAGPRDKLFINHRGKEWKNGQHYSYWMLHYAGKGVGIYRIKKWAITFMHAGGLDVATISSITGHSTETILRYLASNADRQQKALMVLAQSPVLPACSPSKS